jgi:large subunit ribosomal protein L30e
MIDVDKAVATVVKTGKVSFGTSAAVQSAKTGKAKMIVLASNCPKDIKEEIEYYSKLSRIPVLSYKGASMDLAEVCKKPFIISALTIRETGDSEILKLADAAEMPESVGGAE